MANHQLISTLERLKDCLSVERELKQATAACNGFDTSKYYVSRACLFNHQKIKPLHLILFRIGLIALIDLVLTIFFSIIGAKLGLIIYCLVLSTIGFGILHFAEKNAWDCYDDLVDNIYAILGCGAVSFVGLLMTIFGGVKAPFTLFICRLTVGLLFSSMIGIILGTICYNAARKSDEKKIKSSPEYAESLKIDKENAQKEKNRLEEKLSNLNQNVNYDLVPRKYLTPEHCEIFIGILRDGMADTIREAVMYYEHSEHNRAMESQAQKQTEIGMEQLKTQKQQLNIQREQLSAELQANTLREKQLEQLRMANKISYQQTEELRNIKRSNERIASRLKQIDSDIKNLDLSVNNDIDVSVEFRY